MPWLWPGDPLMEQRLQVDPRRDAIPQNTPVLRRIGRLGFVGNLDTFSSHRRRFPKEILTGSEKRKEPVPPIRFGRAASRQREESRNVEFWLNPKLPLMAPDELARAPIPNPGRTPQSTASTGQLGHAKWPPRPSARTGPECMPGARGTRTGPDCGRQSNKFHQVVGRTALTGDSGHSRAVHGRSPCNGHRGPGRPAEAGAWLADRYRIRQTRYEARLTAVRRELGASSRSRVVLGGNGGLRGYRPATGRESSAFAANGGRAQRSSSH